MKKAIFQVLEAFHVQLLSFRHVQGSMNELNSSILLVLYILNNTEIFFCLKKLYPCCEKAKSKKKVQAMYKKWFLYPHFSLENILCFFGEKKKFV